MGVDRTGWCGAGQGGILGWDVGGVGGDVRGLGRWVRQGLSGVGKVEEVARWCVGWGIRVEIWGRRRIQCSQ